MLAMTILLLDFALLPICLTVLVVLLVLYWRRWSAYKAQGGARHDDAARKGA